MTAINGTPLDDQDRGEQIMRTLGSTSEAHVTVIRNGQQQDLTLNIAQVEQEAEGLATPTPQAPAGAPPQAATPASHRARSRQCRLDRHRCQRRQPPGSDD